jgi:hypothetical protein
MVKLQNKGLIDIISQNRKKIYKIKPKEVIQEYLLEYARQIKEGADIISDIYSTEEALDIPIIGFAGFNNIQNYFYTIVDTAKDSVIAFMPAIHYDDRIVSLLKKRKDKIIIKLIFHERNELQNVGFDISELECYILKQPAFIIINTVLELIGNFLQKQGQENSYAFQLLKNIGSQIDKIFGLAVVDRKKSLFKIPLPVDIPMAILSTLPQIVNFHSEGIDRILEVSNKV